MPIFEPEEERKSYSALFLVTVGLLLAGSVWAVWDDNISRRPWKKHQSDFFDREHESVTGELRAEDEKLAKDPAYQEATAKLAEAKKKAASGETAVKLASLGRRLETVRVRENDLDLRLRIVKSEIEEARYEYEHAQELGASGEAEKKYLEEREAEKAEVDGNYKAAQEEGAKIESEMTALRGEAEMLEEKLEEMTQQRQLIVTRLEGLTTNVPLGFFTVSVPPIPKIQQVVLPEFDRNAFDQPVDRVDRCTSCHAGVNKPGFDDEPHPYRTHPDRTALLTAHPPEKFACTPCHEGQGAAVNSPAQAHGEVAFWEHPLLRGDKVQSSCLACHVEIHRLPHTATIATAEKLFEQLGCHGCHLTEGYDGLPKVGPSLRRIAAKSDPAWMVSWVEDPHEFRPRSKMPWFLFSREQSEQVVAFLLSASRKEANSWRSEQSAPEGVDPADSDLVARGRKLVDSVGCRGCHAFAPEELAAELSEGKDVAPNLSRIGEKTDATWIYNWIRDPRGYDPDTRMPNLRLSNEEVVAITSYLLTLEVPETEKSPEPTEGLSERLSSPQAIAAGEKLVRKYGCFGCHDIPGMEKESRVGVELSFFGSKTLEELFFGYRHDIPRTWDAWTGYKLEDPRIYQTEFIEQAMPNYRLQESEIQALRIFLASRVEHKVPPEYRRTDPDGRLARLVEGRRLVERYNCVGCHVIDQRGGQVRSRYEENPNFAPPILNGEGEKVQSDWLFTFLKNPISIRPWLQIRMPTFGLSDDETQAIVEYFLALDQVKEPFTFFNVKRVPPEHLEAAKVLVSADYFSCFSCHQQGDEKPEGSPEEWAPDLAMANQRLNPEWIAEWIADPQKIMPGTKMPSFYPGGPEDVLGGSEEKQILALRDYLMVLGREDARALLRSSPEDSAPPAEPATESQAPG